MCAIMHLKSKELTKGLPDTWKQKPEEGPFVISKLLALLFAPLSGFEPELYCINKIVFYNCKLYQ